LIIRQCVALLLVSSLLALCSPAIAGDLVSIRFTAPQHDTDVNMYLASGLPNFSTRAGLPGTRAAFYIPPSGQQTPSQAPPGQPKHLTTTGKVLKWVGIGLMAEGAVVVGLGTSVIHSCNSGEICVDRGLAQGVYYGIGGASIATGVVLLIVGLHKKE
jgi:hypothetical protein